MSVDATSVTHEGSRTGFRTFRARLWLVLLAAGLSSPGAWGADLFADADVTRQVQQELARDPTVPFNTIDVRTDDGVVTLSGTVSTILARDRAVRIAETIKGVRSIVDRLRVEPTRRTSGEALAKDVEDALFYDAATDSYEVDVTATNEGTVMLTGTVDSWAERSLTETVAKSVIGVRDIDNRISVSAWDERTPGEIRAEIEERLRWDVLVDHSLIDVSVQDGRVELSGKVGSAAERRRAEYDALIAGVETVDTSALDVVDWAADEALRYDRWETPADADIRDAVQDALLYDPRVLSFNLDVSVSEGDVTLSGVVDNLEAKRAAVRDARNTVGVRDVTSLVQIRPDGEHEDADLRDRVARALKRSPHTGADDVDVRVENGTVYLSGEVDSYSEKAEIENVAYRAKGVTDVRNYVTVLQPQAVTYDPYVYDWTIYDYGWYEGPPSAQRRADRIVRARIEDRLIWSPYVDEEDVRVTVTNGVATLNGEVPTWRAHQRAEESAREGGALSVINKLAVN